MRIMHFSFSRKSVSYSLLTMLTIALLFSCKKDDDVGKSPAISYQQKVIVIAEDAEMIPVRPDSTGGVITEYTISPLLPKGLMLNKTNGVISGTPSDTLAATTYVVKAFGPGGFDTDTLTLLVGTVGFNYGTNSTYTLETGTTALTTTPLSPNILAGSFKQFFVSPSPDSLALKTGLTFNYQTGQISGTPNKLTSTNEVPTPLTFTITGVTTANKAASATVTFIINDKKPDLVYTFGGSFTVGTSITAGTASLTPTLPATSGVIKKYRLAPGSPALPAGLTLDSTNGKIQGTPTEAANVTVVVRALNTGGYKDVNVPLVVNATAIAPQVYYFMSHISTSTGLDTLCPRITSGSTIYLTRNDSANTILGSGAAIPNVYLRPVLIAGQASGYSVSPAYSNPTDGLSFNSIDVGVISGTPKLTTTSIAPRTITINNLVTNGPAGTFDANIEVNSPFFTYSSGTKGGTFSNVYYFVQGQPVEVAAPNANNTFGGYPGYTTAELSIRGAGLGQGGTYTIYPADPTKAPSFASTGLTLNPNTGAISGTPTVTSWNINYSTFWDYVIVGRKADGKFTIYKIRLKIYKNTLDWGAIS